MVKPNVFPIVKIVVISDKLPGLSEVERLLDDAGFTNILSCENLRLYADTLDWDDKEPIDPTGIILTKEGISYTVTSYKYAILDMTFEFEGLIQYFDLEDELERCIAANYIAASVVARRKISEGRLQSPSL